MKTEEAKRITHTQEVEIFSDAGNIFTLACPVEELKWIEGWEDQYEMIFSESGVNEKNCIFSEKMSGLVLMEQAVMTNWITTVHDPVNHRIEFLLMVGDKAVINFQFDIRKTGENISLCKWTLIFTAMDKETNHIPEKTIKERMRAITETLSMMLKHYCEKGEMMRS